MQLLIRLSVISGVFILFSGVVFADPPRIAFDWQPFTVNHYFELNHENKTILPKEIFYSKEIWGQYDGIEELKGINLTSTNNHNKQIVGKSMLGKIKITVSQVSSFMLSDDEIYSKGKNDSLSRAGRILPSLLQNPSSETALETLKLIQPQINLGFEF